MNDRLFHFVGGGEGQFSIEEMRAVCGESLPLASKLYVGLGLPSWPGTFSLRGVVSHERYVTRAERSSLVLAQEAIGRKEATWGAFIPLKKSAAWWALTQDERRQIFEEDSAHIRIGMKALPRIARRLHHCRDLEEPAPFDFLTWFDFRAEDTSVFDDLLAELRATEEWKYVEREVDVRVVRSGGG